MVEFPLAARPVPKNLWAPNPDFDSQSLDPPCMPEPALFGVPEDDLLFALPAAALGVAAQAITSSTAVRIDGISVAAN